jgi:hypothetical protein
MLVTLYALATTFGDHRLALLTATVAVFNRGLDLPYYARNVNGEIPALFFTFAALWLWLRDGKRRPTTLAGVGILFGLACVTKNQLASFICIALLLAWLLELVWYRQRGSLHFIIPGIITGVIYFAWTVYICYFHDAAVRDVSADLAALQEAGAKVFFVLDPPINSNNIFKLMSGSNYSGVFLPVVAFGLLLSLKRDEAGQRWGILSLFLLLSLGMFITSIGWPRFAVPPLAFATLVFARLVYDLTDGLRIDVRELFDRLRRKPVAADVAALVGVMLVLGTVALPVLREAYHAVKVNDNAPYRVADYIEANIPEDALIETWEEELAVLTNHTIHYPPQIVEAHSIEWLFFGGTPASSRYDFRDYVDPEYVIVGKFGKWGEVYPPEHLTDYTLIHSIEDYDIYQRADSPGND